MKTKANLTLGQLAAFKMKEGFKYNMRTNELKWR